MRSSSTAPTSPSACVSPPTAPDAGRHRGHGACRGRPAGRRVRRSQTNHEGALSTRAARAWSTAVVNPPPSGIPAWPCATPSRGAGPFVEVHLTNIFDAAGTAVHRGLTRGGGDRRARRAGMRSGCGRWWTARAATSGSAPGGAWRLAEGLSRCWCRTCPTSGTSLSLGLPVSPRARRRRALHRFPARYPGARRGGAAEPRSTRQRLGAAQAPVRRPSHPYRRARGPLAHGHDAGRLKKRARRTAPVGSWSRAGPKAPEDVAIVVAAGWRRPRLPRCC
jgi:hypothetical protein